MSIRNLTLRPGAPAVVVELDDDESDILPADGEQVFELRIFRKRLPEGKTMLRVVHSHSGGHEQSTEWGDKRAFLSSFEKAKRRLLGWVMGGSSQTRAAREAGRIYSPIDNG